MFKLTAGVTLKFVLVLLLLVGDTSQIGWAAEEHLGDPKAMGEECLRDTNRGSLACHRACYRAVRDSRSLESCRAAYDEWKKLQSTPETASGAAETDGTPAIAEPPAKKSAKDGVNRVTVMGVPLCGDVVQAGEYLEGQGYKNAALLANSMRRISVSRREGKNNYDFKINYGGARKRDSIYLMSFYGSFQDGPNLFEVERSKFEEATGIELTCNSLRRGPKDTRLECTYPAGEADRSQPGFSYSIAHEEGQKAFFVDAAAWGYEDCGP